LKYRQLQQIFSFSMCPIPNLLGLTAECPFLSAEGTGAYIDASYNSVEELDEEWHVGLARVLGHVMAHELGHLLLGSNAHSRQGIMRRQWYGDDLHLASKGSLLFSEDQARSIRKNLAR
jgi:hypothetical protein